MWVARNENGGLFLWKDKPIRHNADRKDYPDNYPKEYPIVGCWVCGFDSGEEGACGELPGEMFPDLTWESEPIEVNITRVNFPSDNDICIEAFNRYPRRWSGDRENGEKLDAFYDGAQWMRAYKDDKEEV